MADIAQLIGQLPPDANVFDFLANYVNGQVYPDLGPAFHVHVYLVPILCSLVIIMIAASFMMRWQKGRLLGHFFLSDGPLSRPNPKLFVPALWALAAVCMIAHTFWLRSSMQDYHLTRSIGTFWWMLASPVTCSYAVISASVMCTSPIVRKALIRINGGRHFSKYAPSVLLINGFIVFVSAAAIGSAAYPASIQGDAFVVIHKAYTGLQAMIAQAKATGDLALLASFETHAAGLEEGAILTRRATDLGGAVYSAHIIFFFLAALFPSIFLNIYMRKRINQLENGLTAASLHQMTTQHARSIIPPLPVVPKHLGPTDSDMETLADHTVEIRQQRVEIQLPKDRPFGNLVSPNSMLPQNYATIFQARVEPVEKARRLRLALRQDNFQLAAYTCMLSFLATLAGFQWAGGPHHFNTKQQFLSSYLWEMYSYLIPALILGSAFLFDALRTSSGLQDDEITATTMSTWSFAAPPLTSIQLSQTVEVVEEHALQDKRTLYEKFDPETP